MMILVEEGFFSFMENRQKFDYDDAGDVEEGIDTVTILKSVLGWSTFLQDYHIDSPQRLKAGGFYFMFL